MFSLCPEYQEENKAIFQLAIEITIIIRKGPTY